MTRLTIINHCVPDTLLGLGLCPFVPSENLNKRDSIYIHYIFSVAG